jgi:hypothetical protein
MGLVRLLVSQPASQLLSQSAAGIRCKFVKESGRLVFFRELVWTSETGWDAL